MQDLIAIKRHANTSRTLRRTVRLDMDYMTRTAPFGRGLMCDLFWHLESEMHWRAVAKGQIRCKGYASCRNIQRLHGVLWRGRLCNTNAKRNFEAESFCKASFGLSHGNEIPPWVIRDSLEPN